MPCVESQMLKLIVEDREYSMHREQDMWIKQTRESVTFEELQVVWYGINKDKEEGNSVRDKKADHEGHSINQGSDFIFNIIENH